MAPRGYSDKMKKWAALLPFGYVFISRMRGVKGFAFNALTLWMPGLIISADLDRLVSIPFGADYFAGYLAFICIYETGYLVNDSFGVRHDEVPRRRVDFGVGPAFISAFIFIRILSIDAVGGYLGRSGSLDYWATLGLLVAAVVLHNVIRVTELKFATFFQMSVMRFSSPILLAFGVEHQSSTLIVGALLFSLPRLITYLEAKGRLRAPGRHASWFNLCFALLLFPCIALISLCEERWSPVLVWLAGALTGVLVGFWRASDVGTD